MKTPKILLGLICIFAIVGGVMAFNAKKIKTNKGIARTLEETKRETYDFSFTGETFFARNEPSSKPTSLPGDYSGIASSNNVTKKDNAAKEAAARDFAARHNPANYVLAPGGVFCSTPKVNLCAIRIFNSAWIYSSTYSVVAYRNKPMVDQNPLKQDIEDALDAGSEYATADYWIRLKP